MIIKSSNNLETRAHNVKLEYTKIQDGKLLDTIFVIDADDGQRFELKLCSEEVSNI